MLEPTMTLIIRCTGWDPTTGLGGIHYPAFKSYATKKAREALTRPTVQTALTLEGISAQQFGATSQAKLKALLAENCGFACGSTGIVNMLRNCTSADVSIAVNRRSVRVSASINMASSDAGQTAASQLGMYISSISFVNDLKASSVNVTRVIVVSIPSVVAENPASNPTSNPSHAPSHAPSTSTSSTNDSKKNLTIVLVVCGIFVFCAVCGNLGYFYIYRPSQPTLHYSGNTNKRPAQDTQHEMEIQTDVDAVQRV